MNHRLNPLRLWTALGLLVLGTVVGAARAGAADGIKRGDLVFVTEDLDVQVDGCDAVSVFDFGRLGNKSRSLDLFHGETHVSPGRLAASSDLSIVMASPTNTASFLYLFRMDLSAPLYSKWTTQAITDTSKSGNIATLGGIAILPGDREFLIATSVKSMPRLAYLRNNPPFQIRKYAIPKGGASTLGTVLGAMDLERVGVSFMPTRDGRKVHVLTDGARIHTIDADVMKDVDTPIRIQGVEGIKSQLQGTAPDFIHADLSLDERYMITNRGAIAEISISDLVSRTTWTLATGFTKKSTGGLSLNRGADNHSLLAIHHGDTVAVYRFVPPSVLDELSSIRIPPRFFYNPEASDTSGPHDSIKWAGNGSFLIASSNGPPGPNKASEFVLIEVKDNGTKLEVRDFVTACPYDWKNSNFPNDILTSNSPNIPPPLTPTPTPTETPTPTITPSPTNTPSPTRTLAPSATPSSTSTPTTIPSSTPSPTPSPTSRPLTPIYLPIILTETCTPGQRRADVLLVIDTSSSMLELTSAGRPKIEAAREAAGSFIDLLQLPSDQAGVAWFNETAGLAQPLTGDRVALRAALRALTVHQFTRIDLGVQIAHAELLSPRHRAGNAPVLILLTDGRSNPVPASFAVDAAARAKADGVTVFTIGVGRDLDEAALAEMASPCRTGADCPYYFKAPDAEELGAIYRRIAGVIPCGAEAFWGRR